MKTLSLYQPWASLVVLGAKKFETRSWSTQYRGPLLIHASKKFSKADAMLCREWPFDVYIKPSMMLDFGAIIGRVDLVDCITTESWTVHHQVFESEWVQEEYSFGDYSHGRFAWKLKNPVKFDEPIPAKGSLGLWEFPESSLGHLAEHIGNPS